MMLILSARLRPKQSVVLVLLLGVVMILAVVLCGSLQKKTLPSKKAVYAASDLERAAYLRELGWEVDPVPTETLTFTLPSPLDESYAQYNSLQLQQGFDLTPYAGQQLTRYSYTVTNHPTAADSVQANLYLSDHQIVAGDILCCGEEPFVDTLTYP